MGKILTTSAMILLYLISFNAKSSDLDGLAKSSKTSNEAVVKYVKSGIEEYANDPVVKNCLAKAESDQKTAIYALFNYIMYLDTQSATSSANNLSSINQTRRLIKISSYAKKSINYCNN